MKVEVPLSWVLAPVSLVNVPEVVTLALSRPLYGLWEFPWAPHQRRCSQDQFLLVDPPYH